MVSRQEKDYTILILRCMRVCPGRKSPSRQYKPIYTVHTILVVYDIHTIQSTFVQETHHIQEGQKKFLLGMYRNLIITYDINLTFTLQLMAAVLNLDRQFDKHNRTEHDIYFCMF